MDITMYKPKIDLTLREYLKFNELTHALLLDILDYNPETGILIWRKSIATNAMEGTVVSSREILKGCH